MSRPRQLSNSGLFVVSLCSLSAASAALAGPIWDGDYQGDAKQSAESAQVVTTNGTVLMIKGQLTGSAFMGPGDFIDMYLVRITTPSILKLSTAGGDDGGFTQFDSQLFLFRANQGSQGQLSASAVFANNDASAGNLGSVLTNQANDGSQFTLTESGLYFIAITSGGVRALNPNGAPLWPNLNEPGLQSFAGFDLFQTWGGDPNPNVGAYEIRLTGIAGVPAPGAVALLGLAGLAKRRRR